jgi:hypothetical protein
MKPLPWFRMYHEALDDEKLRLLACEDRWHFVALLCCKAKGILDDGGSLLRRKVAVKLGLSTNELDEVARRLSEVGLINYSALQPIAWNDRQMQSDSSAVRTKAYRERIKRHSDVTVTTQEEDTDIDIDKEEDKKNKKATGVATPDGVSDSLWQDFKKLRTAKKSPITQTAISGISREAAKAGLSLPTVLEMCCERGWVGFKAEWTQEKRPAFLPPQPNETVPSKTGIDPTLAKLNAEKAFVKPPSAEMRAKLAALKEGRLQ